MPDTRTIPASLRPLVEYLDGLSERASIEKLRELLGGSTVSMADLEPFICFKQDCYQRNLICSGEHYELLAICWDSGQRSPIHDHAKSTCGFRVMKGICTETVFGLSPCGQVVALYSKDLREGHVTASQDADTHQVSNVQGKGDCLVTLHIYSPPLKAMRKFSITGERDGRFAPGSSLGKAAEEG